MQDFSIPMAQQARIPQQQVSMGQAPQVQAPEIIDPAKQEAIGVAREVDKQKSLFEAEQIRDQAKDKALMQTFSQMYNFHSPDDLEKFEKSTEFSQLSDSGKQKVVERKLSLASSYAKLDEQLNKQSKEEREAQNFKWESAVEDLYDMMGAYKSSDNPTAFEAQKKARIELMRQKKDPLGRRVYDDIFLGKLENMSPKELESKYKQLDAVVARTQKQAAAEKSSAEALKAKSIAEGGSKGALQEKLDKMMVGWQQDEASGKQPEGYADKMYKQTAEHFFGSGGAGGSITISPTTIRKEAEKYVLSGGDPSVLAGQARSRGNVAAIHEEAAKVMDEWGITPQDMVEGRASTKASTAAQIQMTKDIAAIKPYKKMLDTNANMAIELGKKIMTTDSRLANKTLNWVKTNIGDNPDTAEYLAQMRFVTTEAARVLNNPRLVGVLSDEARKEMEEVLSGNMPLESVQRVLERIQSDGKNRIQAMEDELNDLSKKTSIVGKKKETTKLPISTTGASQGFPGIPKEEQAKRDKDPVRIKALINDYNSLADQYNEIPKDNKAERKAMFDKLQFIKKQLEDAGGI